MLPFAASHRCWWLWRGPSPTIQWKLPATSRCRCRSGCWNDRTADRNTKPEPHTEPTPPQHRPGNLAKASRVANTDKQNLKEFLVLSKWSLHINQLWVSYKIIIIIKKKQGVKLIFLGNIINIITESVVVDWFWWIDLLNLKYYTFIILYLCFQRVIHKMQSF